MKKGNYKTARSGIIHRYTGKKNFMGINVYDCKLVAYVTYAPDFNGNEDQLVDKKVTCKNCLKVKKGKK